MPDAPQHNTLNYIEFPVQSAEALAQTRDFFTKAFGWEYKMWGDAYADTQSSGVASGINGHNPSAPPTPLPVVYAGNLEAAVEAVKSAGGTITQAIYSFPGGRRFHFTEPSGNELAVWSGEKQ